MAVSQEFKHGAVELLSPRLKRHVDLSACAAPKLRGGIARLHLELIDRLDRRQHAELVHKRIVVVHAIEQKVVGLFANSTNADCAAQDGILRAVSTGLRTCRQEPEY
jgi:hypothetical protein